VGHLTPVLRISLGLAVLTCAILMIVDLLGVVPEPRNEALESRIQVVETLAMQTIPHVEKEDFASIRETLFVTVRRNADVLSAGLRSARGHLLISTREHRQLWDPESGAVSSATQVRVPVARNGKHWATLEVHFSAPESDGVSGVLESLWQRTIIRLLLLVGSMGFVGYWVYMKRTLRHLDPSAVIPARVQTALDVMSEGVLLLDPQGQIVLANEAFAARSGRTAKSLMGTQLSELDWRSTQPEARGVEFPWWEALREGRVSTGTPLSLEREPGDVRIFLLNVHPRRLGQAEGRDRDL